MLYTYLSNWNYGINLIFESEDPDKLIEWKKATEVAVDAI